MYSHAQYDRGDVNRKAAIFLIQAFGTLWNVDKGVDSNQISWRFYFSFSFWFFSLTSTAYPGAKIR